MTIIDEILRVCEKENVHFIKVKSHIYDAICSLNSPLFDKMRKRLSGIQVFVDPSIEEEYKIIKKAI